MNNKHLKLWTRPPNYMGEDWWDYYVVIGRHRDSDLLTQSNFDTALTALRKVALPDWDSDVMGGSTVVPHETHWAVGWIEWIGVHKDCAPLVEKAEEILETLANYPVLNEDDYYRRLQEEWERTCINVVNYHPLTWELSPRRRKRIAGYLIDYAQNQGLSEDDYPTDAEVEEAIRETVKSNRGVKHGK